MSARGWGSKADLEMEIEALEIELSDARGDLEIVRDLLADAFIGERGTLLTPDVWKRVTEVLE